MLRIGPDKQVSLHFAVRLVSDGAVGDILDSTWQQGRPATFVMGDGNLLAGFEQALVGLKTGDKRSYMMPPEKAFGAYNPDNIQYMKKDSFRLDVPLEVGLMVSFSDKAGELPGVITEVDDDQVTVDFNHPLAGKELSFEVEILTIEPYVAEQPVVMQPSSGSSS